MDLEFRLKLLKDSNQIDEEIYKSMLAVLELFKEKFDIELTEDNGQMMVTHLSKALMRVKNDEEVALVDEDTYNDIVESEYYDKACEMLEELGSVLPVVLPESERKYMIINNALILDKLND